MRAAANAAGNSGIKNTILFWWKVNAYKDAQYAEMRRKHTMLGATAHAAGAAKRAKALKRMPMIGWIRPFVSRYAGFVEKNGPGIHGNRWIEGWIDAGTVTSSTG